MRKCLLRWPRWIGPPLLDGYSAQVVDRRVITDMDVGSTFRVEFCTDENTATCRMILDDLQANWLEAFELKVLSQGSAWFWFPLWVGGQLVDHKVRFRERPRIEAKWGHCWTIYGFTLDVAKREGLMDGWMAEALSLYHPEDLAAFQERLNYLLHTKMPGISNIPADILARLKP